MRIAIKTITPRPEYDMNLVTVELAVLRAGNVLDGGEVGVFVAAKDSLSETKSLAIAALRELAKNILDSPSEECLEDVEPDIASIADNIRRLSDGGPLGE